MWVAYAFGSAFFAGITAILAKIGIKNVDSNVATAVRTGIILVFAWLIVFMTGAASGIGSISARTMLFLVLSGLATGASWLCYFKALQLGNVNKVAPIDKSSTILTMILAFIFMGEGITVLKFVAMLCIAAGTYFMLEKKDIADKGVKSRKWIVLALLSAVFASLTSILGKIGIAGVNSNLGTAIRTIVVLLMAWVVVAVTGRQEEVKRIGKRSLFFICFSGVTTGLSWLLYYKALQDGEASVVVPIDKLSILVTILFSTIILKEKIGKRQLAGLAVNVAGTLLLLV